MVRYKDIHAWNKFVLAKALKREFDIDYTPETADPKGEMERVYIKEAVKKGSPVEDVPAELLAELGIDTTQIDEARQRSIGPKGGEGSFQYIPYIDADGNVKPGYERRVDMIIHAGNKEEMIDVPVTWSSGEGGARRVHIKRENRVLVPYPHYQILLDAKYTETYRVPMGFDQFHNPIYEDKEREVPRFSMTIYNDNVPVAIGKAARSE